MRIPANRDRWFRTKESSIPGILIREHLVVFRPVQVVNEIVLGRKQIVAKTALDLEAALKIPAEFWMNLEIGYQLTKARLERERRPRSAARARA